MIRASAPGKVILFGEHAVVYGRPAIAAPITQVQATAELQAGSEEFIIHAADLGRQYPLTEAPADDPLAAAVRVTLQQLDVRPPAGCLSIRSSIPIASGLGSGAAVTVAIIRALSRFLGADLPDSLVSELAYQVEQIHHGTPSGIDNTVVAFGQAVYFARACPVETFQIHTPFRLLIADTGVRTPTKVTVGDVRLAWRARPDHYEELFDQVGEMAVSARVAMESGRVSELGALMNRNQILLEQLGVSSPELEKLIQAARLAGADGAKLSGGGRGGNLIALVQPEKEAAVKQALEAAGAVKVIATRVSSDVKRG